jgi:hypothetical protein
MNSVKIHADLLPTYSGKNVTIKVDDAHGQTCNRVEVLEE